MQKKNARAIRWSLFAALVVLVVSLTWRSIALTTTEEYVVTRESLAAALNDPIKDNQFPKNLDILVKGKEEKVEVSYTILTDMQEEMERLFKSYRPDYGAFVAMNAVDGRILALVSYTAKKSGVGHLALRGSFPAASIFKIVTAAAAIDQKKVTPETQIPFNGANHTLYRRNVRDTTRNRWTRTMTVREAFAKSVNTVFGKIGTSLVGPSTLEEYAKRFGFNQMITGDLPFEPGRFALRANDWWSLAETASGYTRESLMSPVQGALIAASVANDGVMMQPFIVEEVRSSDPLATKDLYRSEPRTASVTISPQSAEALRELMRETVSSGTSRKSFRNVSRVKNLNGIEFGGKTGSLTGTYPRGKYDWFVGYGLSSDSRIAVAALTINEDTWKVKSSHVARHFFEKYYRVRAPIETARDAD